MLGTVGFRDISAQLSCVVGLGSQFWDRLEPTRRPAQLKDFTEIKGAQHTAVATGGDLFFHIRAIREDFCFELEKLILEKLGSSVTVSDEVRGFRYFDDRDLLGFVDGTANPTGPLLEESAVIGSDDPEFIGGSYITIQKYLHEIPAWQNLTVEKQEAIIGRTKLGNVELDDADPKQLSHKTLATIATCDGQEYKILRDNMPFGHPGESEFGTYFIGYTSQLWVLDKMLERMFLGTEESSPDHILDFSRAVTGATFFAPTVTMLKTLGG